MQTALMNVRFEGNNGHDPNVTRCLLMTQSGRHRQSISRMAASAPIAAGVAPERSESKD